MVKEALDQPKEKKFHQVESTFENCSQQLAPVLESLNYVVEALSLPKVNITHSFSLTASVYSIHAVQLEWNEWRTLKPNESNAVMSWSWRSSSLSCCFLCSVVLCSSCPSMRSGASAEGHKMDAIQGARIVVATGSPSVPAIDNVLAQEGGGRWRVPRCNQGASRPSRPFDPTSVGQVSSFCNTIWASMMRISYFLPGMGMGISTWW